MSNSILSINSTYWRIALLFFCLSLELHAQKIQMKDIPHIDKLPVNAINTIFQDSQGYIWHGTEEGLCRDDGYDISIFRSDFKNPDVMLSNVVLCLAEDSVYHNIWIGTDKGLYVLNKYNSTICPVGITNLKNWRIEDIRVTADHSIWVSIHRSLYRFSPDGELVKVYPLECVDGAGKEFFLYEDREKQLLLSISGKGLHKWNRETDEFELFFPYQSRNRINAMLQDKEKGYYWLASWNNGIIRIDPLNPIPEQRYVLQPLPVNSAGRQATTVTNIVQDDVFQYIWTTSWSDLFAYRITAESTLEQVDTSSFLPQKNKAIKNIMKDRHGDLWVTALDNNNFVIHFDEFSWHKYAMNELEKQSKWSPIIEQFCRDESGTFWLFQRRLGLTLYQPDTGKVLCYADSKVISGYPFLVLFQILKSRQEGLVWVVPEYHNKIYGLSQKNLEFQVECKIDLTSVSENSSDIRYLYEDKNANLWICTYDGLYVYHTQSDELQFVSTIQGTITQLTAMEDGTLWGIVKEVGLIKIDSEMKVETYPSSYVFLCIVTMEKKLWLGTNKGELVLCDPETMTFKMYSKEYGMNGNKIHNMVVDEFNHIWLVTSQEIKRLNPHNGACRSIWTSGSNIGFDRFLPKSFYEAPDGEIYFGGVTGVLSVIPTKALTSSPQLNTLLITDLKIMGNSIWPNRSRIKKNVNTIEIYPWEHNMEIWFSSLDYQNSQQIRYAYRLVGNDKDWIYLPAGENAAFYNKLEKGIYTFQVKATDKNGLWRDHIAEITIHRLPDWYETWWIYILYVCILLGLAYYAYQRVRNRIRLRNALLVREMEQTKAEEVNHAKLQFFTNVSHELLTPLTILSASVAELKQIAPGHNSQYKVMTTNINRLIRLLQQILEFRKADTGNLKLKVSLGDMRAFIQGCVNGFLPLMKQKKIEIEVSCESSPFMAWFDSDKFDKIIYNLFSNAAKYSRENEKVQVELKRISDKEAQLTVKDNGPGIPKEAQKDLFKRFYEGQYRKFNVIGTGIGLSLVNDLVKLHHGSICVESEEGHGTAFIIRFPTEKAQYASGELDITDALLPEQDIVTEHGDEDEAEVSVKTDEKGKRSLLLIEDNEDLLQLMMRLLAAKYMVYTAKNGKEGIDRIEQHEIDLIISDVMMPVMDGIEFCKYVKGNFNSSHIPILLLTAKKQEEDRVEAYKSGADGFISKPFSLNVLYARIENLLAARMQKAKDFKKQIVFEAQELNYTSLDEEFMKRAIDCVHRHLDDPEFGQLQFVEEMGTTRSTAFRKLKSLTGLTFPTFIRNIRMKAACRLMEEKKTIRISELAYAVGYSEPHYFSVCFKKEFGMLPLEYIEQLAEKNDKEEK